MPMITRRNALKLGLAGGALALATPSKALVEIVVTGGNFTPLPIAIPDFASSDPAFGAEIAQIVRDNLRRSGLFVPLDPASLPADEADVVTYIRQLMRTNRTDRAVFDRLKDRHGVQWLVELTAIANNYAMLCGIVNAFEVDPPPDGDRLPASA